jgi:hypothetical protein
MNALMLLALPSRQLEQIARPSAWTGSIWGADHQLFDRAPVLYKLLSSHSRDVLNCGANKSSKVSPTPRKSKRS